MISNQSTKYFAVVRNKIGHDALKICYDHLATIDIYDCNKPTEDFLTFCSRLITTSSKGNNSIFLLNLWGDKIFTRDVIECLSSSINLHPGLLPAQAGSHTITKAILNQEVCGCSINQLHNKLDKGNLFAECCPISASDLNSGFELRSLINASLLDMLKTNAHWILKLESKSLTWAGNNGTYQITTKRDVNIEQTREISSFKTSYELLAWILAYDFACENSLGKIKYKNSSGETKYISLKKEDLD